MTVFKKMFIAAKLLSSRDTEKLKTTLYFSRQDASKYASGDTAKLILKFGPRSGLLIPTHNVQILRHYRKYVESKFKKVSSLSFRHMEKSSSRLLMQIQKVFFAPPSPNGQNPTQGSRFSRY